MIKERAHRPYRRLLFASDFSEACRAALRRARALFPGAPMTVLHGYSVPMLGLLDSTRDQALADTAAQLREERRADRKSTRLNSSHVKISYAVFCLTKTTH